MRQVISISPEGVVSGLQHKKDQGLDLRQFGRAEIVRASEVVWDDRWQKWRVEFREGAGQYAGTILSPQQLSALGVASQLPAYSVCVILNAVLFDEYDDAVKAEIAVLNTLRLQGKLTP